MDSLALIIPAVLVPTFVIGVIACRRREKKDWNNGVCAESGLPWLHFDTDSQGGRGYKDGQGNYIWVSYRVDK